MDDLLTVRQLQELLRVDRITIYRMLDDGRLSGFKVGSQWRFSRRQIEKWLSEQANPPAPVEPDATQKPPAAAPALPINCYQLVQEVFAETLDIACVTTDMHGEPVDEVSNGCAFCRLILENPEGQRLCSESWTQAAQGKTVVCHAGLSVVAAPVDFGEQEAGIVAACQFVCGCPGAWQPDAPALARRLGAAEEALRTAAGTVHSLTEYDCARLPRLLSRLGGAFCEMGQERAALLGRLRRIAEMTSIP